MKDTTGIVAAGNVANNGPYPSKGGSEEILTVARSRMKMAISAYSDGTYPFQEFKRMVEAVG